MSERTTDELRGVHERIATLEGQLRELDQPERRAPSWTWVALGMGLTPIAAVLLIGLGGGIYAAFFASIASDEVVHETTATLGEPPKQPLLGARWYPQSDVVPLTMDVNGDGRDDLVGLAWNDSQDKQLLVVAFDGKTFQPLWSTAAYRGTWHSEVTHLRAVSGLLVMTDASGDIHVLDPATGKVLNTMPFPAGVELPCAAPGSDVLLVNTHTSGTAGLAAFNVRTGQGVPVPKDRACSYLNLRSDKERAHGGVPNDLFVDPSFKWPPQFYITGSFASGGILVGTGTLTTKEPSQTQAHGIAWDRKTKKVLWEHALLDANDLEHQNSRYTQVDEDSVLSVYQAEGTPRLGPFRVVSWSLSTGEKQWATTLPQSAEGSWLGAFGEAGDRVYVLTNTGLHVLDRKTGAVLTTLERF